MTRRSFFYVLAGVFAGIPALKWFIRKKEPVFVTGYDYAFDPDPPRYKFETDSEGRQRLVRFVPPADVHGA